MRTEDLDSSAACYRCSGFGCDQCEDTADPSILDSDHPRHSLALNAWLISKASSGHPRVSVEHIDARPGLAGVTLDLSVDDMAAADGMGAFDVVLALEGAAQQIRRALHSYHAANNPRAYLPREEHLAKFADLPTE